MAKFLKRHNLTNFCHEELENLNRSISSILVFYCFVTDYYKIGILKWCLFIIWVLWVRSLGTVSWVPCSESHKAVANMTVGLVFIWRLDEGKMASKLIKVVGRIHFLATVWLMAHLLLEVSWKLPLRPRGSMKSPAMWSSLTVSHNSQHGNLIL